MSVHSEKTLIYLHGFMGSSQSLKAQQTSEWMRVYHPHISLMVPDLPVEPVRVAALIKDILKSVENPVFVGSSLGGFYANYFSEQLSVRAVMINPAVYPHELLAQYIGVQQSPYTEQQFEFRPKYLQQLRNLLVTGMKTPDNRMVLLQTGDETLNYREAESYYEQARCVVEQGGDHSFSDYPRYLPQIADFLFQSA